MPARRHPCRRAGRVGSRHSGTIPMGFRGNNTRYSHLRRIAARLGSPGHQSCTPDRPESRMPKGGLEMLKGAIAGLAAALAFAGVTRADEKPVATAATGHKAPVSFKVEDKEALGKVKVG